jgi:HSP20 family protein
MKLLNQEPVYVNRTDDDLSKGRFHFRKGGRTNKWRPPTDIYETKDAIIVRIEIAGMRDSDFSITLSDHTLSVEGIRTNIDDRTTYHQMEIRFGEFLSEINILWPVDAKSVEAEYKDGFLRLVLPKTKPHKVEIEK